MSVLKCHIAAALGFASVIAASSFVANAADHWTEPRIPGASDQALVWAEISTATATLMILRSAWRCSRPSYCQKLCMGLSCGGAILAFSIHEFDASNDLGELI